MNETRDPAEPGDAAISLRLAFESAQALADEFTRSLGHGALFVPGDGEWQPGQPIRVCLDLRFCDREVEVSGTVAAVRPAALVGTEDAAGVALQLRTPADELRLALEQAAGISLCEDESPAPGERRQSVRGPVRGMAVLAVGDSSFPAEMLNLSYGGMLVLLRGLALGLGGSATAMLQHPETGQEVCVESRIVSQALCDHGAVAVGIQFHYPAHRIDEVMAFIDDLRSLQQAKQLAQVSGSLSEGPLEDVLQTVASSSSEGTLRVSRGDEQGIIIHRDGELLHASTGLVCGMKAVSRLLLWRQGRFDYQAAIEPFETPEEPLPIEAALLTAAVSRDEAVRHSIDEFDLDDTFSLDVELMDRVAPKLDEVHQQIAEHVRMDFPLGAILDILVHGDGVIYKALIELLESGVVSRCQSD